MVARGRAGDAPPPRRPPAGMGCPLSPQQPQVGAWGLAEVQGVSFPARAPPVLQGHLGSARSVWRPQRPEAGSPSRAHSWLCAPRVLGWWAPWAVCTPPSPL